MSARLTVSERDALLTLLLEPFLSTIAERAETLAGEADVRPGDILAIALGKGTHESYPVITRVRKLLAQRGHATKRAPNLITEAKGTTN